MRLHPRFNDPEAFAKLLQEHLDEVLQRLPCKLTLIGPDGEPMQTWNPGWIDNTESIREQSLKELVGYRRGQTDTPLSQSKREEIALADEEAKARLQEAGQQFRLMDLDGGEGELPQGMGRYRIRRVVWENRHGTALFCCWPSQVDDKQGEIELNRYRGNCIYADPMRVSASWRGMRLQYIRNLDKISDNEDHDGEVDSVWSTRLHPILNGMAFLGYVVDFDLIDIEKIELAADRNTAHLPDETLQCLADFLQKQLLHLDQSGFDSLSDGVWQLSNNAIRGRYVDAYDAFWVVTCDSKNKFNDTDPVLTRHRRGDTLHVPTEADTGFTVSGFAGWVRAELSRYRAGWDSALILSHLTTPTLRFYRHAVSSGTLFFCLEGDCTEIIASRSDHLEAGMSADRMIEVVMPEAWSEISCICIGRYAKTAILANTADPLVDGKRDQFLQGYQAGESAPARLIKPEACDSLTKECLYGMILRSVISARHSVSGNTGGWAKAITDQWDGMLEHAPDLLRDLFAALDRPRDGSTVKPLRILFMSSDDTHAADRDHPADVLVELRPDGFSVVSRLDDPERFGELVPIPEIRDLDA